MVQRKAGRVGWVRDGRAPIPKKESTSRIMSAIKDKNTKPEIILRKALWNNGVRGYRLHLKAVPGRPDIAFPGKKVVVFVNGCFWHKCPYCNLPLPKANTEFWKAKFQKNVERDKRKIDQLREAGWKTIRIWECQVKNDLNGCLDKVKKLIDEAS